MLAAEERIEVRRLDIGVAPHRLLVGHDRGDRASDRSAARGLSGWERSCHTRERSSPVRMHFCDWAEAALPGAWNDPRTAACYRPLKPRQTGKAARQRISAVDRIMDIGDQLEGRRLGGDLAARLQTSWRAQLLFGGFIRHAPPGRSAKSTTQG